uniref:hypothetical protein n=1 Tax=Eubacterium sp. TaxID=142586 RepID=UPI0040252540
MYPMSAFVKVENGYYFFNRLMLYYFDAQTKETYPVCNKPNCDHTTSSCMAFFNIFNFYPFLMSYYKNTLYVWGWEEDGSVRHNYIYSVSLDDYKRKKAAFLYDGTNSGFNYFIVHRGYIYYVKNGGTDLKEQTAYLYRVKIGDTSQKREEEPIYEFSGIGASVWNVTASGNNIIVNNSAYGDTEGNDYKNSYTIIDIHSLKSKELVENGNYSVFADGNYVYYGKNENTVYRIDLATNEETFFCDIDGPCYISADSNYVYFDNLQSIYAGTDADNRKIQIIKSFADAEKLKAENAEEYEYYAQEEAALITEYPSLYREYKEGKYLDEELSALTDFYSHFAYQAEYQNDYQSYIDSI